MLYDDATGKSLRPGDTLIGNATVSAGVNVHRIDAEEGEWLFQHRFNKAMMAVVRLLKGYPKTRERMADARLAALENMAYNLGETRLRTFNGMLKAIHAGDWERAAREVLFVNPDAKPPTPTPYVVQLPVRGRRNAEMLRTGEWPAK